MCVTVRQEALKYLTLEDVIECTVPEALRGPLLLSVRSLNTGEPIEIGGGVIHGEETATMGATDAVVDEKSKTMREERASYILAEMVTSEETYVNHLKMFWDVYVTALKEQSLNKGSVCHKFLSHRHVALLLSSLKQIMVISIQFLKDLKSAG